MTTPFYAPPDAFDGASEGVRVTLPPDEARHATRVLRLGAGDTLSVVDGAGGWHDVCLDDVAKDRASGIVTATRREVGEPEGRVVLGLAPLKSSDRFETAVEKAVELGVTDLLVLRTARTLGRMPRAERMHHLAVAAMKQSLRTRLLRWHDVPFGRCGRAARTPGRKDRAETEGENGAEAVEAFDPSCCTRPPKTPRRSPTTSLVSAARSSRSSGRRAASPPRKSPSLSALAGRSRHWARVGFAPRRRPSPPPPPTSSIASPMLPAPDANPDVPPGDRPGRESDLFEPVVSSEEVLRGKLVHVFRDTVQVPGRGLGTREWLRHPGASAVVPLFGDGTVVLVRQYRHGPRREFLEVPAGKLDAGEAPEVCARREVREETGLTVERLTPLGPVYPAIGYSDEVIHLFLGEGLTKESRTKTTRRWCGPSGCPSPTPYASPRPAASPT